MTTNRNLSIIAAVLLFVSACQSVGDTLNLKREPLTLQQQAALAVGVDYQTALGTIGVFGFVTTKKTANPTVFDTDGQTLPPAPADNAFGPRIGQYFLADEYVVYRHALAKPATSSEPVIDAVTGQPVPVESDAAFAPTEVRLTYFLVSPKGIVDDYALGTLNVSTTACLQIISGVVVICDMPDRLSEDFDVFDAAMRTSKFASLDSWNISANAVSAQ
ncbi:MAG: hypothetical protein U5K75_05170 [Ahrensia sp.]|nr:hypothetical protein [Ahrensia sp.]